MKQERLIQCWQCKGEGMISTYLYDTDIEGHIICPTCEGECVIPDPDDFETTLSDLVQAKEKFYDND